MRRFGDEAIWRFGNGIQRADVEIKYNRVQQKPISYKPTAVIV